MISHAVRINRSQWAAIDVCLAGTQVIKSVPEAPVFAITLSSIHSLPPAYSCEHTVLSRL